MDSMVLGVIVAVCAVLAIVIQIRYDRNKRREAQEFVEDRTRVTNQEFSDTYFPNDTEETAIKVREILSKYVPVDVLRVLPSDRMNDDLHMNDLDSMASVEFILDLEKEFKINISDLEAQRLLTVGDVISLILWKNSLNRR